MSLRCRQHYRPRYRGESQVPTRSMFPRQHRVEVLPTLIDPEGLANATGCAWPVLLTSWYQTNATSPAPSHTARLPPARGAARGPLYALFVSPVHPRVCP
eukprot:81782-Chlamydomonas_euryale.AAC.2